MKLTDRIEYLRAISTLQNSEALMATLQANGDSEIERILLIKFIFFEVQSLTLLGDVLSEDQIQKVSEDHIFFSSG